MTTTTASAVLVPAGPVFSEPERLALAGFLAGYSGLTREAYALDLRQFAAWCLYPVGISWRYSVPPWVCARHGR
jgi:hypothetical protein